VIVTASNNIRPSQIYFWTLISLGSTPGLERVIAGGPGGSNGPIPCPRQSLNHTMCTNAPLGYSRSWLLARGVYHYSSEAGMALEESLEGTYSNITTMHPQLRGLSRSILTVPELLSLTWGLGKKNNPPKTTVTASFRDMCKFWFFTCNSAISQSTLPSFLMPEPSRGLPKLNSRSRPMRRGTKIGFCQETGIASVRGLIQERPGLN
jgi:hypothetical protein